MHQNRIMIAAYSECKLNFYEYNYDVDTNQNDIHTPKDNICYKQKGLEIIIKIKECIIRLQRKTLITEYIINSNLFIC